MENHIKTYKRFLETHLLTLLRVGYSLLVFLILCSTPLRAQVKVSETKQNVTKAQVNFGLGVSSAKEYSGITGSVSVQYTTMYGVPGIRYVVSDTYGYEPNSFPSTDKIKGFHEIGVLWGHAKNLSFLEASASIGAGKIWGTERVSGSDKKFSAITIPVEVQLLIKPLPIVGIGVAFTTSINKKSTFSSGLFVIQFGKSR